MLLEESKEVENLIEEESHAHDAAAQQLSNLIQSLHYDLLHDINTEQQLRQQSEEQFIGLLEAACERIEV